MRGWRKVWPSGILSEWIENCTCCSMFIDKLDKLNVWETLWICFYFSNFTQWHIACGETGQSGLNLKKIIRRDSGRWERGDKCFSLCGKLLINFFFGFSKEGTCLVSEINDYPSVDKWMENLLAKCWNMVALMKALLGAISCNSIWK